MRTTTMAIALLACVTLAAIPTHAVPNPVGAGTSVSGSYLFGSPAAYAVSDACSHPATNGIDSSCANLPTGVTAGRAYTLVITDALTSIQAASVCYYSGGGLISCNPTLVPPGAVKFSVSSNGGADVDWIVTFG